MARYTLKYVPDAQAARDALTGADLAAVQAKERQLERDPTHAGTYDRQRKDYRAVAGRVILQYRIFQREVTVLVTAVPWAR